jgi:radical SAM protein with 4Fe4S-binding SPASM domain
MKQQLTQEKKHQIIVDKYGSNFCAAPFNSLHEGPDGLVSTCCKTREPIGNSKEQTFTEMYNSEHIKSVRRQFLLNQKPKQCQSCWVQESNGKPSNNRAFCNASGFDTIDDVVANTDPDGTLNVQKPGWLDLLWTNKCNFACLGCSPELSTTIAKNHKKSFSILNGIDYPDVADDSIQWKNNNHAKIDYILKNKDTITMIHLNGGEPFLSDDIFELLDVLLANNLHKTIKIWSHTNGSVTHSYKGVDIVNEYLVHWGENASITMSNDGNGLRGEYIRYGYRDKKWLETYLKIKEAKIKLNIQTCLNVFNGLAMEEIGQWLLDNCTHKGQTPFGSLTLWTNDSTNIRLYSFDEEVKQKATSAMQNLLITKQYPTGWERHLPSHLNWINPRVMPDLDHARKWYNGTVSLDTERGTSFDAAFPELIDFRNNINRLI